MSFHEIVSCFSRFGLIYQSFLLNEFDIVGRWITFEERIRVAAIRLKRVIEANQVKAVLIKAILS